MSEPHSAGGLGGLRGRRLKLQTLGSTNWRNKHQFVYSTTVSLNDKQIKLSCLGSELFGFKLG